MTSQGPWSGGSCKMNHWAGLRHGWGRHPTQSLRSVEPSVCPFNGTYCGDGGTQRDTADRLFIGTLSGQLVPWREVHPKQRKMFTPTIHCFVLLTGLLPYGETLQRESSFSTAPTTNFHSTVSSRTVLMSSAAITESSSTSIITSQDSDFPSSSSTSVSPTMLSATPTVSSTDILTKNWTVNPTINSTTIPMNSSKDHINSSSAESVTSSQLTSLPTTSISCPLNTKPTSSSPLPSSSATATMGSGASMTTATISSTQLLTLSSAGMTGTIVLPKTTSGDVQIDPEQSEALSAASIVGIVLVVIIIVIVVFGGAFYLKMRRASYGRLLEDSEYSSVGNFQNPLYEQ